MKILNKLTDQSQFTIKFANFVLLLAVFCSILIACLATYNAYEKHYIFNYSILIIFCVISATLFSFGLMLSNHIKINLSILVSLVVISVYAFEVYLEFVAEKTQSLETIAKQLGVPFDSRTKVEVLNDLIETGIEGYPYIAPSFFIKSNGLGTNDGNIYPLGGISTVTTVYCNESGLWLIYEADEYGFNNPKGLYQKNKVEILLSGDSMAEGACVAPDKNISAVVRKLGFNAISIARGGNGPLIEFATLKEYAESLKPKIVLWLYYDNDFNDLVSEISSSLLSKYLDEDDYSQNLIAKQDEIDRSLKNYILESLEEKKNKISNVKMIYNKLTSIIKLVNLRESQKFHLGRPNPAVYKKILVKAQKLVSGWGGSLYFVYIPSGKATKHHPFAKIILSTVMELGIPIIDIHSEVIVLHPDPLSLIPFRTHGHFNAEGYRLVAEAIVNKLKLDGIILINPE